MVKRLASFFCAFYVNLKIAHYVRAELETYKNVKVVMTRTGDTYPTLLERSQIAAINKADFSTLAILKNPEMKQVRGKIEPLSALRISEIESKKEKYTNIGIEAVKSGKVGAILLAGGTKGKRYALPSSRVMIHQPRGGVEGQESDISILAKEIIRLKKLSIEYLAKDTGKSTDKIAEDIERDFFMSAQEAAEYGVIDQVMPSRK